MSATDDPTQGAPGAGEDPMGPGGGAQEHEDPSEGGESGEDPSDGRRAGPAAKTRAGRAGYGGDDPTAS